ncbi:DUF7594 domain-containing protein [Aquimarina aggregata]|uniref:CBM96 family carbohydrate-binding protein n=1 Tax=Aquimarina aggregata TaxID=1642818 RepID=UPI00248F904F|nr:carbohydrate-binding protein [Aquimarina aggregata]
MKLTKLNCLIAFFLLGLVVKAQTPEGELKRWHKVSLTFNGPNTSETANPNPFSDFRLDVTFTHQATNRSYTVPGYFAACGNAENTGCKSGNKWRAHFTPDQTGAWNWSASFKSGSNVAINGGGSGAGFMNGNTGSFAISESDKSGRDHRAKDKGRLQYVGEHYLRYSGTNPANPNGNWFVKAGADSPENALNYVDFDATPSYNNNLNKIGSKTWQPHQRDYVAADASSYTWSNGKGTEILGMINYLSSQGANVVSFLTWNTSGDGGAVFPHVLKVSEQEYGNTGRAQQWNKVHHDRFDVSKLAQWEKMMEYADKKGIYLHFKTMETENDNKMDGDNFGRERKLYYRELIARFSHHLALNWNLTEETTLKDNVAKATASYIKDVDPYDHNIVIHTYPNQQDQRYNPLLGNSSVLTGASIQTDKNKVHNDVKRWLEKSRNAGRKWVVANDEQGPASTGIRVSDKEVRHKVLWGTLMAGGTGVEYYSGYTNNDGDINGNDHRKRGNKYKEGGYALNFFNKYLQGDMIKMTSSDGVTSDGNDYVLANAGKIYAVYRPNGGSTGLSLPAGNNKYDVQWYNPRNGGNLTAKTTLGGNLVAPDNNDWVALITSKDGNGNGGGDGGTCDNTKTATPSQDAYLQGTTKFNTADLRVESGNRISYLKFTAPSTTEKVTGVKLELTVSSDGGNGLIEVFKGNSNNWTEGNLSNGNKPAQGTKIGSLNTTYSVGQSYKWDLTGVTPGETISLIIKQTGGNDVSFSSKEGSTAPKLIFELDCPDGGGDGGGNCGTVSMKSTSDFPTLSVSGFSPAYKDNARNAVAIDASKYKGKFAAAEATFGGDTGKYDIKLTTLTEIDGESSYRVSIDGVRVGEFKNPTTATDYAESGTTFKGIEVKKGAKIRVEFNSHTNGNIPEGNGTAFSRGRWTALDFICQGGGTPDGGGDTDGGEGCVALEKNGVVAVEAEHFLSQEKTSNRKWYVFDANTTGTPTPDPDPNHANGASSGGYLEILPDTRVTHGDPLVAGVSFSDVAGQTTIVNYKVKFTSAGKYFVWVRAHSTGTEDNGVHVGLNGNWPASGRRMQWCSGKNKWTWESKQRTAANHCGEERKIFLDIPSAGVHTISFSLREDGFEMDKFVLSKAYTKPTGNGPVEVLVDCNTGSENAKPQVGMTSPTNGATFGTGESITLSADASDSDGTVAKVEFYIGANKVGEDTTAPYQVTTTIANVGSYNVTAKATDNKGASTTSTSVAVEIEDNTPPVNTIAIPGNFEAESFASKSGSVRIENTPGTSGKNLGFVKNGDYTEYTVNIQSSAKYAINIAASSAGQGGTIDIVEAGTTVGTVTIPVTGQWHDYKSYTAEVSLTSGEKKLRLVYKGAVGYLFNVDNVTTSVVAPPVVQTRTVTLSPIHDAYLQGSKRYNDGIVRVEKDNRSGYLMFDLSSIQGTVTKADLQFTIDSDPGNGNINVNKGSSSNWTENNLSNANKPGVGDLLGNLNTGFAVGSNKTISLNAGGINGDKLSLILNASSGNDIAFASKDHKSVKAPQLVITYTTTIGARQEDLGKSAKSDIKVFPVPMKVMLNVSGVSNGSVARIVDFMGILRKEVTLKEGNNALDVQDLPSGHYIITILENNRIVSRKKISK